MQRIITQNTFVNVIWDSLYASVSCRHEICQGIDRKIWGCFIILHLIAKDCGLDLDLSGNLVIGNFHNVTAMTTTKK